MRNKLDGITLHAEGEANCYRLMRGGNWLAAIRMNGELLVWDQEAILRAMLQGEQQAAQPIRVGDLTPQQRLELARGTEAAPVGEREAFEAHMRIGGYSNPDKHPDGSYVSSAMELWWQGWKARSAYQRAQQPQSAEAVAYVLTRDGEICYEADDGIVISNTPGDETDLYKWQPVYFTTPQPSAGVVMPERQSPEDEWHYVMRERSHGWNACLDEFSRLNGKEVGRG